MKTEGLRVDFGRHEGELWTRLPVSYLTWMVNINHSRKEIAEAELKRRGTSTPTLDVSNHAIDRASLRLLGRWREMQLDPKEGLCSWLTRMAREALDEGTRDSAGRLRYRGMVFMFNEDGVWPILTTCAISDRPEEKT